MTAPYNPGPMPGYQPQPQQPPQYQQPMYPAGQPLQYNQQPGFAPAPAYGPQYQPQQPAPLPQQFSGADLNARLGGPGIPQELQGRTVAEGLRYYGIMREEFMRQRQMQQGQQPLQGQPQQQPQSQPQQPQFQQPQQQPFSAQPRVPGQQSAQGDPMREYITQSLREVLPEMLAPVVLPAQQRAVQDTYTQVRSRYSDWQQYEGDIMQSLQGANAQQLSNPEVVEAAYFFAKGRAQSRAPQGQPQPPYGTAPQYQPQWPQQPQQAPPQQWPGYQPQPQFQQQPAFVEGPTPPAPSQFGPQGQQNDPRDEIFARRSNMPLEVYRSWKQQQGQSNQLGILKVPQAGIGPQQGNGQPQQPNYGPPQQQGYPVYPPQQFQPAPQFQQPQPPGWFQPSLNGAGNGY